MAKDLKGEVREQTAHIVAAGLILGPILFAPSVLSGALSGFMVGLVREVTELGNPVNPAKVIHAALTSKLDLSFWAIGGGLTFYIGSVF